MADFSIKDSCDRCGGTEELDGVLNPQMDDDGGLMLEQATLCAPCRVAFKKFMEEQNG